MTTPTLRQQAWAFYRGFCYGRKYGYATPRQAEAMYPEYSYDLCRIFLNGVDDGVRGDRYRVNLTMAEVRSAH